MEGQDNMAMDTTPEIPVVGTQTLAEFSSWEDEQQSNFVHALVPLLGSGELSSLSARLSVMLRRDFILHLPCELAEKILLYLTAKDLCVAEQVSRGWRNIINVTYTWKKFYERRQDHAWKLLKESYGPLPRNCESSQWKISYRFFCKDLARVRENWAQGQYKRHKIECDGKGIYCLQYDTDKIVCGSRDNTVKIFDMQTHQHILSLEGHSGSVLCLQFDGEKIISGSSDSSIRIWDMKTFQCAGKLDGHALSVLHLRFDRKRLVTCSKDKTVRVWTISDKGPLVERFEPKFVLDSHKAAVNVVEFNDQYIVSASGDRTINVWDTNTGVLVSTLTGHQRGIACLQFSNGYIVSGSSDETIKVWNVDGQCLRTLTGHRALVRCVRFDERYIISGSYDRTVRIWDFETGKLLHTFRGHANRVFRVQFDAFKIVSSSQDDHIIIWDFHGYSKDDPNSSNGHDAFAGNPVRPGAQVQDWSMSEI